MRDQNEVEITTATHSFETEGLYIEHAGNGGRAKGVAMMFHKHAHRHAILRSSLMITCLLLPFSILMYSKTNLK